MAPAWASGAARHEESETDGSVGTGRVYNTSSPGSREGDPGLEGAAISTYSNPGRAPVFAPPGFPGVAVNRLRTAYSPRTTQECER